MKTLLFLLGLIGLFGCSTHSMHATPNAIHLNIDETLNTLQAQKIKSSKQTFISLRVMQNIYETGHLLTYEDVNLDIDWELAVTNKQLLKALFEPQSIRVLYKDSSLYVAKLYLEDKTLNILVQRDVDYGVKLLYGLSNQQMQKLLTPLKLSQSSKAYAQQNTAHAIKSKWSTYTVNFTPLVQPRTPLKGI